MSIEAALTALAALRCEGVADGRHYAIGASVPDSIPEPALFLALAAREDWTFAPESYDARAATLSLGVVVTLLIEPYRGRSQPEVAGELPTWLQRLMNMLAADLLLSDNLVSPLAGNARKIGVLSGRQLRYLGVVLDLNLLVRIEAA